MKNLATGLAIGVLKTTCFCNRLWYHLLLSDGSSETCCMSDMETLVYLMCIAVASFAVLAQPGVAQGANTTLPLTYPGQVLQGNASQTCPSEEKRERMRNEVDSARVRSTSPATQSNLLL